MIKLFLGAASFRIIEEHFSYLSHTGRVVAIVLGLLALAAALTAPLWFARLSKPLASNKYTRWMSTPQFGYIIPFAAALLLFPVCGLFSSSIMTFWLFLLFGWGGAAILLYTGQVFNEFSSR
jgi:hypothetical protein